MAGKFNPGLLISFIVLLFASGCAQVPVNVASSRGSEQEEKRRLRHGPRLSTSQTEKPPSRPTAKDLATVRRVITEKELRQLGKRTPIWNSTTPSKFFAA